jgi:hypothetical protein
MGVETVPRDRLPVLFAGVEHRAWINQIERCLYGHCGDPPGVDRCRFGTWLNGEGREHYGELPAFTKVVPLHAKIHRVAADILTLKSNGLRRQAMGRLGELEGLRDQLMAGLRELLYPAGRH